MILKALADYYHSLAQKGKIVPEGWSPAKVSFALVIGEDGELLDVMPLKEPQQRGKKTVEVPRILQVPQQVGRSSGVKANYLCDHAGYLLGMDARGNAERAKKCFEASKALHLELLKEVDCPAARAVYAYFTHWEPEQAAGHPVLQEKLDQILEGGNLVFHFRGSFVHEDEAVRRAWDAHFSQQEDAEVFGRCLVTGEEAPIARLHPAIKGVRGAQSSGAMLVSFHAPAFESYGKTQSYNAPVGEKTAFAYTSALTHLLKDQERVQMVGDTTVVFWAENAEPSYRDVFYFSMDSAERTFQENDLLRGMHELARGHTYDWNGAVLRPETNFYILGLAPNAARLSVRFFYRNTFGGFMEHIERHYERLEMIKPSYESSQRLSIHNLLFETVNKNAKDKSASPLLSGALYRAILNDTPYPEALVNGVLLRIRAEHNVTWGRASILKAVLLKKNPCPEMKEALTVKLNDDCTYLPKVLGRLFSVYEAVQQAANSGINSTIKDKYFNSAAGTPAFIFPMLTNLASKHLRKLDTKEKKSYEQQITDLNAKITEALPTRQSLPDQEIFYIGYYHQTQKRYEKKNKEE